MSEHLLSSKSRNLGVGWSNVPGKEALSIRIPTAPDAVGGLRAVETEFSRASRLNNSNFWSARLFVGGQRIEAVWGHYGEEGAPGWFLVDRLDSIKELLFELREGRSVRVRTEEG